MIQITNLTDAPSQQTQVILADKSVVQLTLTYRAAIQRWSLDVAHPKVPPTGALNCQNLCVHPNILRQFRNVIPFGLACVSTDGGDPFSIEDFASGRITIYVLDSSAGNKEVQAVEQNVFGGPPA